MKRKVVFQVAQGYGSQPFHTTESLAEAVSVAVAASLFTGTTSGVRRAVEREDDGKFYAQAVELFRVNASTVDFRQAAPEFVLAVQAMACELDPEVHNKVQPKLEGDQQ